jgi:hypothetical protein
MQEKYMRFHNVPIHALFFGNGFGKTSAQLFFEFGCRKWKKRFGEIFHFPLFVVVAKFGTDILIIVDHIIVLNCKYAK